MTPEDIQSIAGAVCGITVGLAFAWYYVRKQEARRRAQSEWIALIYKNVNNAAERKRLLFTARCDLSPAELELLTPPAYRPRK